MPQKVLSAIDRAACVLCERPEFESQGAADTAWSEAVLVACGGLPYPGSEAISQVAQRMDAGDEGDGAEPSPSNVQRKESKEARVRRALDKHLHKFWGTLASPLDDYKAQLRAARNRNKGTVWGMAVDDETARPKAAPPAPAPPSGLGGSGYATGATERRARSNSTAAARAAGKELQAQGLSTAYVPTKPYSLSLSDLASRRYLGILEGRAAVGRVRLRG